MATTRDGSSWDVTDKALDKLIAEESAWYREDDPTMSEEDAHRIGAVAVILRVAQREFLARKDKEPDYLDALIETIGSSIGDALALAKLVKALS